MRSLLYLTKCWSFRPLLRCLCTRARSGQLASWAQARAFRTEPMASSVLQQLLAQSSDQHGPSQASGLAPSVTHGACLFEQAAWCLSLLTSCMLLPQTALSALDAERVVEQVRPRCSCLVQTHWHLGMAQESMKCLCLAAAYVSAG